MNENVYITYNKMSNDNVHPVYVRYFRGKVVLCVGGMKQDSVL